MTENMKTLTNEEIVKCSVQQLVDHPEWEKRYADYAEAIKKKSAPYQDCAKTFEAPPPLKVYTSIGKVKEPSRYDYDLRFGGQSVGLVEVKGNVPYLTVREEQAKGICKILGIAKFDSFEKVSWRDDERAKEFRKLFQGVESNNSLNFQSKEHRIESKILEEFGKSGPDKLLRYIKPIKLGGQFFQLVTPFAGSRQVIKMCAPGHGGGIDILARVTHKKKENEKGGSRIAIIELKDENKSSEPQAKAMKQALIYATFIARLLRSKSGDTWWNIFRGQEKNFEEPKQVPKDLHLDVVTLMPKGNSNEGSLASIEVEQLPNTTFHLYTLYYDVNSEGNPNVLEGTFCEALRE